MKSTIRNAAGVIGKERRWKYLGAHKVLYYWAGYVNAVNVGICITKAMNRPLAALWRRRQALVDIKSAPPAIPLDTPVTGMVLAREVQKKEKSSNYNFQDDGDTSSVPAVHV